MPSLPPAEAIRLDQLSFTYPGQSAPALAGVSLTVRRGEMIVVMGATGAGKSTLAKCLNRTIPGFQPGTLTGDIAINGRTLQGEGVADLAGIVGLVSQDFEAQLFATNVQQEIAFGMEQLGVAPEEMRRRVPAALATVGLGGFDQRDPSTLSGGEKQRLALAATLALHPSILVFDEPTTDLDPLGKLEIFGVLGTMRQQGYTLVVIEHETAAATHADRVVILDEGRIVAQGAPSDVLTQVDLLEAHGVRAPDLSRIATRLHLPPLPRSLDEAARLILAASPPATVPSPTASVERLPHDVQGPRSASGTQVRPALVSAERVEFAYDARRPVLRGVSLRVEAGEFVALIGQNGSGKTTLAKHLNGLLRPAGGQVLLQGTDVRELPLNHVAAEVGYVFQNPDHQIFASTVYDEVAFGPRNFGHDDAQVAARVAEALDAVGLTGLEGEDPFLLGKGHRQRLAVASLLALRPRLLILDEPTTGLDYREQRRMMDLLAQLHAQGMAIVMITHSPWVVAEYAERGVLMRDGQAIFDGSLRALLAEEALLASAHFQAPDVTRLGRRLGFTPLSVDEFVQLRHTRGPR